MEKIPFKVVQMKLLAMHITSGGQSTQIKYLSKSTDTYTKYYSSKSKSTAFSILLEWKYKSTQFLCT